FVVPKPDTTEAVYDGVAGFLKGVWYVSAPEACQLHLRGFNNAHAEQTAYGMFEAGNLAMSGQIAPSTVLHALRTMPAAKVNDKPVLVNWVMVFSGTNGTPIVRGNMTPDEAQRALHYEAVWMPADETYDFDVGDISPLSLGQQAIYVDSDAE